MPASTPKTHELGVGAVLPVFLLSVSMMCAELTLTRVFSVLVWYHLAFFAISVALLGTATGALVAHRMLSRTPTLDARRVSGFAALGLAAALVALEAILLRVIPALGMDLFSSFSLGLLLFFGATAAPFVCGGLSLSLYISTRAREMRWVYLGDLAGAALAAASLPWIVGALGGPRTLIAAAIPACAVAGLAFDAKRPRALSGAFGLALVAIAALGGDPWFSIRAAKGYPIPADQVEFSRWNSFSLVTVMRDVPFPGWGRSPRATLPLGDLRALTIDLNALTPIMRFDGRLEALPELRADLTFGIHAVLPRREKVCVLGAGGGRDVLSALLSGAAEVTAVEINPLIVREVMLGRYRAYSGGLYARPDVKVVVEDGRIFVRTTRERFDLLQLSMVDTSAATAAGAYALTENSLYTTEAFVDYLRVLRPGGALSVGTASFPGLATGARLASIARAALVSTGRDPTRAVVVLATPWLARADTELYDVLIKPDGWSTEELERAVRWATALGFSVVSLPGRPVVDGSEEHGWVRRALLEGHDALGATRVDLSPTTDDRPFFFYQNRSSDLLGALFGPTPTHFYGNGLVFLSRLSVITLVAMALFLVVPLRLGRAREERADRVAAAYVFLLGVGFMLLEIPLLQRFSAILGNPTASLSVVLSTLLLSGGLGSAALNRTGPAEGRRLTLVLLAIVVYGALLVACLGSVGELLRAAGPTVRTLAIVLALAPLGFLCGAPLSIGLRLAAERAPTQVPWLFGINGAASVMGSVFATLFTLHAGLRATTAVGLVVYAVAAAVGPRIACALGPRAELR